MRHLNIYPGWGTRFLKDELIKTFKRVLQERDLLFLCEIYYAGGTAIKDISSRDLAIPLQEEGRSVYYHPDRQVVIDEVAKLARPGDGVIVMGARDETLREFSMEIIQRLKKE